MHVIRYCPILVPENRRTVQTAVAEQETLYQFVLIDRRCPINRHAAEDEAQKDWLGSANGCSAPAGGACELQARRLQTPACW
jgi:hypothetical protein